MIRSAKKAAWFLNVPEEHKNSQTSVERWLKSELHVKKMDIVTVLMFCNSFVALTIIRFYPTCFKKHLHRRQG